MRIRADPDPKHCSQQCLTTVPSTNQIDQKDSVTSITMNLTNKLMGDCYRFQLRTVTFYIFLLACSYIKPDLKNTTHVFSNRSTNDLQPSLLVSLNSLVLNVSVDFLYNQTFDPGLNLPSSQFYWNGVILFRTDLGSWGSSGASSGSSGLRTRSQSSCRFCGIIYM